MTRCEQCGAERPIHELDAKPARLAGQRAAAGHLYSVKVAWRNEVMHPKQTYTLEQARGIFDSVRIFMVDLAAL